MVTKIIQFIIPAISKALDPKVANLLIMISIGILSYVAAENMKANKETKKEIISINQKIADLPEQVDKRHKQRNITMYADATEIVNKLKKAICENNKEIINAIELSQREKDLMIKKMEAEFRSIVREAERIKVEEEREIRKTDTTKLKRGSGDIQYRELNQIILPVYLIFREMKLEDETKAPQVAILEISFSCPKNLKGFLV